MKFILFALIAIPCFAQAVAVVPPATNPIELHVVFTPQGAASIQADTGKRIKGVEVVGIRVCGSTAATVASGVILTYGAGQGIAFLSALSQSAVLNQAALSTWAQIGIDLGSNIPSVATGLIAAKLVTANGTWGAVAAGTAVAFAILKPLLTNKLPSVANFVAAEIPLTLSIPGGGCAGDYVWLARFTGPKDPVRLACTGWTCQAEK